MASAEVSTPEEVKAWSDKLKAQGYTGEQLAAAVLYVSRNPATIRSLALLDEATGVATLMAAAAEGQALPGTQIGAILKAKLESLRIQPKQDIMQRIFMHYPQQAVAACGEDIGAGFAEDLYRQAEQLPGTTTRSVITEKLGISINGPWQARHPNLISGMEGSRPIILKFLRTHEADFSKATAIELQAVQALGKFDPSIPLVPVEVVNVTVEPEDGLLLTVGSGQCTALKMPRYIDSLENLPQLSLGAITEGGKRVCAALKYMHGKGLGHMDVKPANIVIDQSGNWFLCDFDSTITLGTIVERSTPLWYPGGAKGKVASVDIDFGMLLVTLAVLTVKDEWAATLGIGNEVVKAKVLQHCDGIQHPELHALMQQLMVDAKWRTSEEAIQQLKHKAETAICSTEKKLDEHRPKLPQAVVDDINKALGAVREAARMLQLEDWENLGVKLRTLSAASTKIDEILAQLSGGSGGSSSKQEQE